MKTAGKISKFTLSLQKEFASYVKDKNNILDIGLFYYNHPLVKQKKDSQAIYGFDIRKAQLPPGYDHIVQGDVQEISKYFPQNHFDIILLGEVIEHLLDPYKAIGELSKILKNGGLLILSTPNPHGFPLLFVEWLNIKRYFYTKNHAFSFPPRWLERMLESNKFKVIKKYGLDYFFSIKVPIQISYAMVFVARKDDSLQSQYQIANFDEELNPQ